MYAFLLAIYIIICFALTIVILLQSSKGGGLAGAFGGTGGMGAVFGGRGAATFLSRVTTVLATAFLVISLVLSFLNRGTGGGSLVEQQREKAGSVPAAGLPTPSAAQQQVTPLTTPDDLQPALQDTTP